MHETDDSAAAASLLATFLLAAYAKSETCLNERGRFETSCSTRRARASLIVSAQKLQGEQAGSAQLSTRSRKQKSTRKLYCSDKRWRRLRWDKAAAISAFVSIQIQRSFACRTGCYPKWPRMQCSPRWLWSALLFQTSKNGQVCARRIANHHCRSRASCR